MLGAAFDFRRRMKWQSWLLVVSIGLAFYFGYHAVNGSRGLLASQEKSDELVAAERKLAALQGERKHLEQRVKRLRPNQLDPDLIDELARETLSLVEPDDVIILLNPKTPTSDIDHR